jgi:DNA-binding NarL/FixJ family response regulator
MSNKISVLLVDDHSLVRRGFRRILEDARDITVVGEASDGAEAVKLAVELRPQLIVMDCALPGLSGLDATRRILEKLPETHILMLSMHSEDTWVRPAGEIVLDPQISRTATLKGEGKSGLTVRELEVLKLIVAGKSNKEIATDLDLSANTVAVHRANIMDALGMHKTAELVVYAIRSGLVNIR